MLWAGFARDGKDKVGTGVKELMFQAGFCFPKSICSVWCVVAFPPFPRCGAQTGDNFTACNKIDKIIFLHSTVRHKKCLFKSAINKEKMFVQEKNWRNNRNREITSVALR